LTANKAAAELRGICTSALRLQPGGMVNQVAQIVSGAILLSEEVTSAPPGHGAG
jgi:hypothetical protein